MFWGVIRAFEHSFVVLRIFLFISAVCFIPRFFLSIKKPFSVDLNLSTSAESCPYTLGIENINKECIIQLLSATDGKIGLIVSMHEHGLTSLAMLHAKKIDIARVICFDDYKSNIIVEKDFFNGLDILLIDLVNVDFAYNQEVLLLFNILARGALYGKHFVILDRPNMMGEKIKGPLYCFGSEHKYIKLPACHGMTVGELAQYYNNQALRGTAKMNVISMYNYCRVNRYMSQSMQLDKLTGYNLCRLLACIDPIDVGLKTACPYESILLPEKIHFSEQQWSRLQTILKELGINSVFFCDVNQQTNIVYRGLRFIPSQAAHIDSFKAALSVIDFFKSAGLQLSFSDNVSDKMSTWLIRQYIKGVASKEKCIFAHNEELKAYYRAAFGAYMYYPLPQLCA